MGRIHLFEFEDQNWFPQFLRNYGTEFLQFLSNKSGIYKHIVPLITETLKRKKIQKIIDLGSGGGGSLIFINRALQKEIPELKIIMTDYYPNINAFEYHKNFANNFDYETHPVDARNVPSRLKGFRTLFLTFHHFRTEDAKLILQNAIDSQNSIAIFEGQERSVPSILAMLFSPVTVLLTAPFIRPFKMGRIIFTYLIPIVPLFVLWEGVVSSLRTYSVKEMKELIRNLNGTEGYHWNVGKVRSGPSKILYLIGNSIE